MQSSPSGFVNISLGSGIPKKEPLIAIVGRGTYIPKVYVVLVNPIGSMYDIFAYMDFDSKCR